MKFSSLIVLCLIVGMAALSAGCSSANGKAVDPPAATVTTVAPRPPSNITYEKHGISFVYPDNLLLTEQDYSQNKPGSFESGEIWLRGEGSDNMTIYWLAMHHRPPNIPEVYESMRKSFQKDPGMSDLKYFPLDTYPATTCGDATLIGHMSFNKRGRQTTTNEGILLWYHAKQDRTYVIDIASGNDYKTSVRETLGSYQQSFRCLDT